MNAIPFFHGEVQLLNWSETHNGGAKIVLQLAEPKDLEQFKLMTIRKGNIAGQRIAVAMVQINDDDEKPVTLKLSQQSALLCKSFAFQQFVAIKTGYALDGSAEREKQAASFVRNFCRIESRSELDSSGASGALYQQMLSDYRQFSSPNF